MEAAASLQWTRIHSGDAPVSSDGDGYGGYGGGYGGSCDPWCYFEPGVMEPGYCGDYPEICGGCPECAYLRRLQDGYASSGGGYGASDAKPRNPRHFEGIEGQWKLKAGESVCFRRFQ